MRLKNATAHRCPCCGHFHSDADRASSVEGAAVRSTVCEVCEAETEQRYREHIAERHAPALYRLAQAASQGHDITTRAAEIVARINTEASA